MWAIEDDSDEKHTKEIGDYVYDFLFPEKYTRRIYIEDLEVKNHTFKKNWVHPFSEKLEIKIGDETVFLTGEHQYTISYKVKNAFLFRDSIVDFYWNFLGGNWDMPFLDVNFNIKLQGNIDLDSNDYFLYGGKVGNTQNLKTLEYHNDTLSGFSPFFLDKKEDLTILIHLPGSYIPHPTSSEIFWSIYAWPIFPFGFMLLFFIVWFFIGKENRIINQVQFYPPKDVDPALAGFIVDKTSDNRDLVSLLPYWASMGIIDIQEIGSGKHKFFAKLYKWFRVILVIQIVVFVSVTCYGLYKENLNSLLIGISINSFVFFIVYVLKKKFRKKSYPEILFVKKKELHQYAKNYEITIFNGLFKGGDSKVELSELELTFYKTLNEAKGELSEKGSKYVFTKNSKKQVNITILVVSLYMVLATVAIFAIYHPLAGIVNFLVGVFLISISKIMDKRSPQGDETLKDVEGFRTFVKKAERHKIEFLLKEDPLYFDKTIAYAVAFGMAEKWGKKFDGIVPPPDWYRSDSSDDFSTTFDRMVASATVTMSVSPSSSSSGSGGGSSGGGFGGGGGSSW